MYGLIVVSVFRISLIQRERWRERCQSESFELVRVFLALSYYVKLVCLFVWVLFVRQQNFLSFTLQQSEEN